MLKPIRYSVVLVFLAFFSIPSFAQEQEYIKLAKTFFNHLDAKQYKECVPLLDTSLLKLLNDSTLRLNWEPVYEHYGKLIKQDSELFEAGKQYSYVFLGCVFEKATFDLKVAFNQNKKIIGFFLNPPRTKAHYNIPNYARLDQQSVHEVTISSDTFRLPATLILPKNVQHPPIVVLVHGSGPNDRDETIQANKPFLDLAVGLAAHGIATLRYDKRTYVYGAHSAPDIMKLTPKEEVTDDALAAIRFARGISDVDTSNIIVLGHSLGAQFAPMIAELDGRLAGIIMMAAPARKFEDVVLDQLEFLLPQQLPKDKADEQIKRTREQVKNINQHQYTDTTSTAELLGIPPSYWNYLSRYDQLKTTSRLTLPILILQGEKDYQVGPKDFTAWKEALVKNDNVSFMLFPGLFHLFMPGAGVQRDYDAPSNVSEGVINVIASWVNHH